jgi:hypothetical protein
MTTEPQTPSIDLPTDLSDEAAYAIYSLLEQLIYTVEWRYYAQIRRHLEARRSSMQWPQNAPTGDEQGELWTEGEIDF